jgi:hypothetical protein
MADGNRIEKLAKKERKKLLKVGSNVEKTAGRPMAKQPSREDDSGRAANSATDLEFPRTDREVPGA